jgi:thiosulfate reductase cytochrome b subunit
VDTTLPQEGTALLSETREREPKSYIPTYSLAYFGVMIALMTPVMVTMALKIKRIVPEAAKTARWASSSV